MLFTYFSSTDSAVHALILTSSNFMIVGLQQPSLVESYFNLKQKVMP